MVRLSDVFGPDGNPRRTREEKPEISTPEPPVSKEIPLPTPLKASELPTDGIFKTDAAALYKEAMAWVRKKFEEATTESLSDLAGGPEIIERILKALSEGGEELLTLTSIWAEEDYIYSHSVNVAIFSIKVGQGLRFNKEELRQLGLATLVHDLGMAKVPKALVEKSSPLSEEEMAIVKKHPIYTIQILEDVKELDRTILDAISHEHERLDGTGYPKGLREEQISEFGGIIAIVDVYEALTHLRPYRKRHTPDEAMKLIAYSMGNQFKVGLIRILKALVRELSIYPIGSYVQLNTKEIGQVVKVNKNFPLLPILDVCLDGSGNRLAEVKRVNLAQEPLVHIKRPVDISEIARE